MSVTTSRRKFIKGLAAGVGDLPTGVYMTFAQVYTGDTMAAIYMARTVLIWMSPAVGAPA